MKVITAKGEGFVYEHIAILFGLIAGVAEKEMGGGGPLGLCTPFSLNLLQQ